MNSIIRMSICGSLGALFTLFSTLSLAQVNPNDLAAQFGFEMPDLSNAPPGNVESKADFGPGMTYTVLPAAAFNHAFEDGLLLNAGIVATCGGNPNFVAPVQLPSGARLLRIDTFGGDGSAGDNVASALLKQCHTSDTTIAPLETLGVHTGSAPVGLLFRAGADLTETIDNENCEYAVLVNLASTTNICSGNALLKSLIRWQRQISPAPAVATFTDVPTTHPFYQSVEAMVAAGITGGLGGGLYGPEQTLTRGQMAAFLSRALGL